MTYNQNSEKGLDHECSVFFVCKNRLKLYLSKDGWFTVYGEYNITKSKRSILI